MSARNLENPLLSAVRAGTIVSGKYRLGELLGRGTSSVVVEAEHLQNGQHYALKLLDPETVRLRGGAGRLVDEIRAVSQLTSAHTVRVFAVGSLETGEPYLVMEYVAGQSLAQVLADTGPMWITAAADFVLETCDSLVEAHDRGLVHGGVKPANIFVAERPGGGRTIKLSDYGIGFSVHDPSLSGERNASTFVHAAPEQLIGQPTDPRTDIWSLGVMLFELVSGRPPFTARKLHDVLDRGHTVAPPLLRSLHGPVPPDFDAVIRRCLSLHPGHRYANVTEFAQALAPFASSDKRREWQSVNSEDATEVYSDDDNATRVAPTREEAAALAAAIRPAAGAPAPPTPPPPPPGRRDRASAIPFQSRRPPQEIETQLQPRPHVRTESAPPSAVLSQPKVGEWEDAPTNMMKPPPMSEILAAQQAQAAARAGRGGQPLLVAEVIPESKGRTALIAVVALTLLLVLPLIYLHSLAKKTTVTQTGPTTSGVSTNVPQEFSMQVAPRPPLFQPGPQTTPQPTRTAVPTAQPAP